jgi:TusA-related sulfurtransferase
VTKIIDARNLSCPQPVVLTKNALKEVSEVVTIVDNEAARDNVSRLGKNQGCDVTVEQKDDGIYLTLKTAGDRPAIQPCSGATGIVLFIASDVLLHQDRRL